jgi:hypothetical protein
LKIAGKQHQKISLYEPSYTADYFKNLHTKGLIFNVISKDGYSSTWRKDKFALPLPQFTTSTIDHLS